HPHSRVTVYDMVASLAAVADDYRWWSLQVRLDDLLFDAEHTSRFRIDPHLDPVNEALAICLQPGKEQVWQRLIEDEEMVIAMCEHDRPAVLLRSRLQSREERLEPTRAGGTRRRGVWIGLN